MAEVLVLQHAEPENLGIIETALATHGHKPRYIRGDLGHKIPETFESAGLIVMGGPMGVYEEDQHPYLKAEKALIHQALEGKKPVLGVCLGSQLLASVLGAKVYPGKKKEIGWQKIKLTEDGVEDILWRGVPHEFVGYHWHGDVFDLPAGAEVLASSELTPIQAYSYGEKAYGFLFHMEVTHTIVENMVRTFEGELKQAGVDGQQILTGADKYLPGLSKIGAGVYSRWATLVA